MHWALLVVTVPYSQPHYPFHKATSQSLLPPIGAVSKQSLNRGLIALLSLIAEQDFLGMLPPEWQWSLLLYNYYTFDYGVNRFLCAPLKEKKEPGPMFHLTLWHGHGFLLQMGFMAAAWFFLAGTQCPAITFLQFYDINNCSGIAPELDGCS